MVGSGTEELSVTVGARLPYVIEKVAEAALVTVDANSSHTPAGTVASTKPSPVGKRLAVHSVLRTVSVKPKTVQLVGVISPTLKELAPRPFLIALSKVMVIGIVEAFVGVVSAELMLGVGRTV